MHFRNRDKVLSGDLSTKQIWNDDKSVLYTIMYVCVGTAKMKLSHAMQTLLIVKR